MSALVNLQRAFQSYVLGGGAGVIDRVGGENGVDPPRRLRIYFDAYRSRLVEVLVSDYEALRALMGPEDFGAACRAYVEATPSQHRNVRWYGAAFPDFLRLTLPWAKVSMLHELALFEWTLTLAFDSADAAIVRFEELVSLPPTAWPALGFVLHPSVHLLELFGNAPALRKATDAREPLPNSTLLDESKTWLIWRKALAACFRSLGEPESWALAAVKDGATFATLCEGLCRWFSPNNAAPQAASLLRQWVDDELISDLAV